MIINVQTYITKTLKGQSLWIGFYRKNGVLVGALVRRPSNDIVSTSQRYSVHSSARSGDYTIKDNDKNVTLPFRRDCRLDMDYKINHARMFWREFQDLGFEAVI